MMLNSQQQMSVLFVALWLCAICDWHPDLTALGRAAMCGFFIVGAHAVYQKSDFWGRGILVGGLLAAFVAPDPRVNMAGLCVLWVVATGGAAELAEFFDAAAASERQQGEVPR